ncbi:hypothetical protein M0R45_026618 [Rubus argutus]|uniref:Uncharacterized protein n=1 Tax=Rubus argutus TaxID=59490 RepID=A0AAW1X1J8_RUBAR
MENVRVLTIAQLVQRGRSLTPQLPLFVALPFLPKQTRHQTPPLPSTQTLTLTLILSLRFSPLWTILPSSPEPLTLPTIANHLRFRPFKPHASMLLQHLLPILRRSKARPGVFGALQSVSPLSIVSCKTGDSNFKNSKTFDFRPSDKPPRLS